MELTYHRSVLPEVLIDLAQYGPSHSPRLVKRHGSAAWSACETARDRGLIHKRTVSASEPIRLTEAGRRAASELRAVERRRRIAEIVAVTQEA